MFATKYPLLSKSFDLIKEYKNTEEFMLNINCINDNTCNTIFVTDYEITSKITQVNLGDNTPITKTTNTYTYRYIYASYVYYITNYVLTFLNHAQMYTYGEYMLPAENVLELVDEINTLIDMVYHEINFNDPLNIVKLILKEIMTDKFNEEEYKFLFEINNNNLKYIMEHNSEKISNTPSSQDRFRNQHELSENGVNENIFKIIEHDEKIVNKIEKEDIENQNENKEVKEEQIEEIEKMVKQVEEKLEKIENSEEKYVFNNSSDDEYSENESNSDTDNSFQNMQIALNRAISIDKLNELISKKLS